MFQSSILYVLTIRLNKYPGISTKKHGTFSEPDPLPKQQCRVCLRNQHTVNGLVARAVLAGATARGCRSVGSVGGRSVGVTTVTVLDRYAGQ